MSMTFSTFHLLMLALNAQAWKSSVSFSQTNISAASLIAYLAEHVIHGLALGCVPIL